jgi:RNA polymerase sigma-70 factor, ECF subfamily
MTAREHTRAGGLLGAEEAIRALHARGELEAAATLTLEAGGPEVLGFLVALLRDRESAAEVFSQFCEDLWAGLPGFRGQGSFRGWVYALARHAMLRFQQDPFRRRGVPLSACPALSAAAARVRTLTQRFLRTDVKSRAARLRERLEPEEQLLLVLRVDRALSFQDIAEVMAAPGAAPAELRRLGAALRKRFERVKQRLRTLMQEEGLLDEA